MQLTCVCSSDVRTSGTTKDSCCPKLKNESSFPIPSLNAHLPIFKPSPGTDVRATVSVFCPPEHVLGGYRHENRLISHQNRSQQNRHFRQYIPKQTHKTHNLQNQEPDHSRCHPDMTQLSWAPLQHAQSTAPTSVVAIPCYPPDNSPCGLRNAYD